jgi:hypothetical protein
MASGLIARSAKGRLAQLVQSTSFTPRGSGVRVPHRPPNMALKRPTSRLLLGNAYVTGSSFTLQRPFRARVVVIAPRDQGDPCAWKLRSLGRNIRGSRLRPYGAPSRPLRQVEEGLRFPPVMRLEAMWAMDDSAGEIRIFERQEAHQEAGRYWISRFWALHHHGVHSGVDV